MKAATDLTLHTKDGEPSPSGPGTKEIKIAKGEDIPDKFISLFLQHNRDYILDLEYKDSVPQLTKEQEKKYGVSFKPEGTAPMQIKEHLYTQEKLTDKLANLGEKKFKDWCEKTFGEENIDKRKSGKSIIVKILKEQEAAKR